MKAVVCGSRDAVRPEAVFDFLDSIHAVTPIELVIEGGQRKWKDRKIVGGVDWFANQWAKARGVQVITVEARWDDLTIPGMIRTDASGRKTNIGAGVARNRAMVNDYGATHCILFWGGRNTRSVENAAKEAGLPIIEAPNDRVLEAHGHPARTA